jgi:sarcosine/dimethylglycine N-methyltransferase
MRDDSSAIGRHYGGEQFAERILAAGIASADQFHTGGLISTREMAVLAGLTTGHELLDIGCGIGGPARILAAEFGCRVTGIDLAPEFVRSARVLTEVCGLSDRVTFIEGNALAMPFEDSRFDVAWTQHVVMNIEDRPGFYRETARVLKPGGRLAFFDILAGSGEPPDYPLPWADQPSISFLSTADETRAFLAEAGFEQVAWEDPTPSYAAMLAALANAPAGSPLTLQVVLGDRMPSKIAHVLDGSRDGRLVFARAVYRKP